MAYQNFDGKGDSRSQDKLRALRLQDLARLTKGNIDQPLEGLSVLDIGCNEGFFCIEAIKQGATRVVGIDQSKKFVESARQRCPAATFIQASWWELPEETFDVIFFLSAIHYEPDQRRLLERLRLTLKPGGVLILECGVATNQSGSRWYTVTRADGPKRYPTESLLKNELLRNYAVRFVGPSVKQSGDPVPRYVYYCWNKDCTALLIAAPGGRGKSNLADEMERRGVPTYHTDSMLFRLVTDPNYSWSPLQSVLTKEYGPSGPFDWGKVAIFLLEQNLQGELAEVVASECSVEAELFCIEGDVLRHPSILQGVVERLTKKNVRSWVISPPLF
jgi:SAM-dependent methyltransferase